MCSASPSAGWRLVHRTVRAASSLRRVAHHPLSRQARRLWRAASLLRPRSAFLLGELGGGTRTHSLPSGQTVVLRHRSRDLDLVPEIFGSVAAYAPPQPLEPVLGGPLRVLDLGGNIGLFGVFALQRWNVRELTSFEPDPQNAALLAAAIAANHASDRWIARRVAISNAAGTMPFLTGRLADSRRAGPEEAGDLVEVVDLFSLDHDVDLLKMDIEGGEWAILTDPRLGSLKARVIVMEWHWRFAPQPDAHGAAVAALENAGYTIHVDRIHLPLADVGLVWASRRS